VPLTNLEQAVEKKAKEQAEALLAEARREAETVLKRETERRREEHARRVEALRQSLENEYEREVGARRAEDRREVLRLKNEILEEVFRRAVEGMVQLPNQGYARWLAAQLRKLPDAGRGMTLRANPRDGELLTRLLKEQGSGASMAEPDPSVQAGFIAQGPGRDLDLSVESLMGAMRDALTERVAAELFDAKTER